MCIICTENDAVKSLFIGSRINLDFFFVNSKISEYIFFKNIFSFRFFDQNISWPLNIRSS